MTPSVIRRMIGYGVLAQTAGAHAVFNCCSSVGEAADLLSQAIDIPVVKIDDRMAFQINHPALETLYRQRLGRTLLITNRLDWSAEQVVAAYTGQQHIEQVFRGLKGGDWLHWGPMHHWTDSKIRIHAFYCLLGISLLNHVHRQAQQVWPQLTTEKLKDELEEICETVLLYPLQEKGPYRTATVLSCQSLIQKTLADTLALQRVCITHRG